MLRQNNTRFGDIMKRILRLGLCLLLFLAWTVFLFLQSTLAAENDIEHKSAIKVENDIEVNTAIKAENNIKSITALAPEILNGERAEALGLSSDYVGYFAIGTASELLWFMENASGGSIKALLISDITLNEGLLTERITVDPLTGEPTVKAGIEVAEWTPIEGFSGILDGGGHSIFGLYIKSSIDNTGLISTLNEGGEVRNLKIEKSYIYSSGDFTGSAVGHNLGKIHSVYNLSDVVSAGKHTGGIAGRNDGAISASLNGWNVQGGDFVGGIAGQNRGRITQSYSAYGDGDFYILGERYIGGITGENFGEICYCYSASSLMGETEISPIAGALGYGSDLYLNYYLSDTESDSASGAEYRNKEAFLSGEVTYLLNLGGEMFYQTAWAEMPSFIGDRVYKNYTLICPGDEGGEAFYSNTDGDIVLNPYHITSGGCDEKCNHCDALLNATFLHTFVDNCDEFCDICGESRIPPHSYINDCDTDCNGCGATRKTEHKYENSCDEACDICGFIRQASPHIFTHPCSLKCSICGNENPNIEHTYTDDCDTVCEFCDNTRTVPHFYDNNCDGICNLCQHERETENHIYGNACDATCDECGAVRAVPDHQYSNGCDRFCNECGFERMVGEHIFDHSCDRLCNECGFERNDISHTYDNPCDTGCNNCGFVRATGGHKYSHGCDPNCDHCGEAREDLTHIYGSSCDKTCDRCGHERGDISHTYNDPCDATCNICGSLRNDIEHTFDNACDGDCNICGYHREPSAHTFGEYRVTAEPTRREEGEERRRCTVCGEEEIRSIPRLTVTKEDKLIFGGVTIVLIAFIMTVAVIIRKRM